MKERHLQYTLTFLGTVNIEGMDPEAARAALRDHLVTVADALTTDGAQLDVGGLCYHSEEVDVMIREGTA